MTLRTTYSVLLATLFFTGCSTLENRFLGGEGNTTSQVNVAGVDMASVNDAYIESAADNISAGYSNLENSIAGRNDAFAELREQITSSARIYQGHVADVRAQLQVGAYPGDPQLMNKLSQAQMSLSNLENHVSSLRTFAFNLSRDLSQSRFLADTARNAMGIQGGDVALRQNLEALSFNIDRASNNIISLRSDVNRLSDYQMQLLMAHREDLEALTRSVRDGVNTIPNTFRGQQAAMDRMPAPTSQNMSTPSMPTMPTPDVAADVAPKPAQKAAQTSAPQKAPVAVQMQGAKASASMLADKEKLLSVADTSTDYQKSLYDAIATAYEDDSNITFTVAGIAPLGADARETSSNSDEAQSKLETILTTMVDMGVPTDRITVELFPSVDADQTEVQVYKN